MVRQGRLALRLRLGRGAGCGGRRCGDAMAARLAWGKTQEGIGMLAAVNALDGAVAETGLLCAEAPGAVDRLAERWPVKPRTTPPAQRRCPIGASPDGLIIYDDGALDVLEIKSVAPFVRGSGNRTMELYDRGPHDNLAPWIVPQVMLEIYCAGARGSCPRVDVGDARRGVHARRARRGLHRVDARLRRQLLRAVLRPGSA